MIIFRQGCKVGLVDADIYGPSLHLLYPIAEEDLKFSQSEEGLIYPLLYKGVKVMGSGYMQSKKDFRALRGPMISMMVEQLVGGCDWGCLDFLIIDLPPGTGDIHLTLCQTVKIDAAVVVTTEQQLSMEDARKGIIMFNELNIPTIALINNFAYFECPCCGTQSNVFQKDIDNLFDIPVQIKFPLTTELSKTPSDPPFVNCHDESNQVKFFFSNFFQIFMKFKLLSDGVIQELAKLRFLDSRNIPSLRTTSDGLLEIIMKNPVEASETINFVPLRLLRLKCRCALCVDEITNKSKLNPRKIPIDICIKNISLAGTYASKILWSDDHSSLYSFKYLQRIYEEMENIEASAGCIEKSKDLVW